MFLPQADDCPLCPTRPGRSATEIAAESFDVAVFSNRFPSFVPDPPEPSVVGSRLHQVARAAGAAEVVVYSDDHHATLADLDIDHIARIVDVWADRYAELGSRDEVAYVFVFENRGEAVGVTLHHAHGQIYGFPAIPPIARRELDAARRYRDEHGACVVCDVVAEESAGPRVVTGNDLFLAYVPFAARLPFEVHVASRRHVPALSALSTDERRSVAEIVQALVRAYDGLFGFALPYVMSMHQAPTDGGDWDDVSHLHLEFTPLHRAADKLKYLAGSELGAGSFVSDVAPEAAAAALREVVA
jgi:UDPglucose--hexose-1-phosphate uridylyltransferase